MSHAQIFEIHIDEGTVNVEFAELPSQQAYQLTLQAQGQCQPEIVVEEKKHSVSVTHTKNCHGNGYREGSIFSLKLPPNASHNLVLNAGTIKVSGAQLNQLCSTFSARVAVGGIRNEVALANVAVERKMVVGAQANYVNKPGEGVFSAATTELRLQVRYGEVRIQ